MDMTSATSTMPTTAVSSVMSMMSAMSTMSSHMSSMSMAMATASSSMAMSMDPSMSMAMPSATSTSSSSSHHGSGGSMGGMDMGGGSCKVHMIWNWQTIDSCFLSSGWHVRTSGQFAGTCIGVFLWVLFLVLFSRVRREFDSYIVLNKLRRHRRATGGQQTYDNGASCVPAGEECPAQSSEDIETTEKLPNGKQEPLNSKFKNMSGIFYRSGADVFTRSATSGHLEKQRGFAVRPSIYEQVLRALMFGFEYSITWLLGLILMSYNGYVVISAFLGAAIGFLIINWETMFTEKENTPAAPTCC